jgi:hypothetical protein
VSAGRGAKSGVDNSCANLRLYGHTSWEVYRQNRFEIRLGTGAKTLRHALQ